MTGPHDLLKRVFGFDHFRGVQEHVVDRVLAGQHTLAVMPTGAGKSLCYQLPAIARDGTALVISPLIAGCPEVPRLALTATADQLTRADILAQLGIADDGLVIAGFDRPNIRYHVRPRDGISAQLKMLLAQQPGPGIVYVPSRDKAE